MATSPSELSRVAGGPAAGRRAGSDRQPVVLLVEPSLRAATELRSELEQLGMTVVEAADGERALVLCRLERPDVVLLSLDLPGVGGHEVLAAIHADVQLHAIPVIALTERLDDEDVAKGLDLGAHDYLRKPVVAGELRSRVGAALGFKVLRDELDRRNAELVVAAGTDHLTGLHNRRHMEGHLRQLTSAARRHHRPLSVLLVDVDGLKALNHVGGNAVGDTVLREVATRIGAACRDEDVVGRWGGDEFLVVLPDTSEAAATVIAERVRNLVRDTVVLPPAARGETLTVSIGCAGGARPDDQDLVRRASVALKDAKARGRDAVGTATG